MVATKRKWVTCVSDDGASLEGPSNTQIQYDKDDDDDDDDFLQEGRRQTETRLEKALARVKSMVQYPDARDQYNRIFTIVTKLQEFQGWRRERFSTQAGNQN